MAFELPKVYHTKSMVELLKNQGHNHLAMGLAEKILAEHPGHQQVASIYESMKDELKNSWAKMSQARSTEKNSQPSLLDKKVILLKSLLERIQENKSSRA